MKKILFVMQTLGFGGAERSLVNLLHELSPQCCSIDLLLFQKKGELLKQLPDWVRVLDTPKAMDKLYGPVKKAGLLAPVKLVGTGCARLLRRTSKAQKALRWKRFYCPCIPSLPQHYDTAVAFGGAELMYFIRDRVHARRKLVWIHSDYRTGHYAEKDDRPYMADMDAIVSISEGCVQVLEEIFPEYREKMHCIENITSETLVRQRAEEYEPQEYVPGGCNLLSVGRFCWQKGFDLAVDAAALLKQRGVDFRWFVIGDGELRQDVERQIERLGLQEQFILLGTRVNPYPYIRRCRLMIQPSLCEGKSVVLDETKILCTPTVATAYPTVRDQILDGKEGLITELSPQGIADGIQRLLEDPALEEQMRTYLRSHSYGNQQEAEKYLRLMDV